MLVHSQQAKHKLYEPKEITANFIEEKRTHSGSVSITEPFSVFESYNIQGVQEKLCFFNAMRVYSHSYWLANLAKFFTTNSLLVLAKERWQNN